MTTNVQPTPHPTADSFGARLALIRWAQGWNIKEAGLACRLPQGSWREWELSGRAPRNIVEIAQKISDATGYSDYWVMTGKDPHPVDPDGGDSQYTARDSNPEPADMANRLVLAQFRMPRIAHQRELQAA